MDERDRRAIAIACATIMVRDRDPQIETLLGLADEFVSYIEGDDEALFKRPRKGMIEDKSDKPGK